MENAIIEDILIKPINYKTNFFLMLFGRLVSGIGSSVFNFALGLYVLDLTGSASKFSLILAASILPGFIVNLVGGVIVDRYDKKIIMVAADVLSGFGVFLYMLLFEFFGTNILLFILYPIILNALQSFFMLSLNTSIPNIVSDEKVAKANSTSQAIWSLMNVVGPVVGALVYKQFGLYPIFVAYGFLLILAGVCEGFLKFNRTGEIKEGRSRKSYKEEMSEAVKYILDQKILVLFFIFSTVMNFIYNPLTSLVIPFINYNVIKVSGLQLSVVQSAGAAGVIIGAFLISMRKSANGFLRRFFVFFQLQGILILMWVFPRLPFFEGGNRWIVAIGFAIIMVITSMINIFQNIPMITHFQVKVPEQLRGKVLGIFTTTFYISTPVGLWIFGVVLDKLDWIYVTSFSGALILVVGLIFSRNKIFRDFTKSL